MKVNEEPYEVLSGNRSRLRFVRLTLCALISLFAIAALYHLSHRLISQIYYQTGSNLLREGYYGLASERLRKAVRYNPYEYRNQRELGKAYHKLATVCATPSAALAKIKEARGCFLRASRLCPIDADTAYYLAITETQLATLRQESGLGTDGAHVSPLPYFETAIRLRPNGIRNHYALAQYLSSRDMRPDLYEVIQKLVRIYPLSYYHLKREEFWSPLVRQASRRGLQQALEQKISIREAHLAFSTILAEDRDYDGAISHYRKALDASATPNNSSHYFHLGYLFLKNRDPSQAQGAFSEAIEASHSKGELLERLYDLYTQEGYLEELKALYQEVRENFFLCSKVDLLLARCLLDLNQSIQAKLVLQGLIERQPSAEAYYWLAKTYESVEDWDRVELAIQKATALAPENSRYHLLFSVSLKRLNKLHQAEKEAGLAIRSDREPSPWLFNHRAWIRLARQDPTGAVADWQKAIQLEPQNGRFYFYAAEAYNRLGQTTTARTYLRKALELDPLNTKYREQLELMMSKTEAKGSTASMNR